MSIRRVAFALATSLFASASQAETRYVNAAATGANNGTSWANAFTSFNDAIGVANPGDAIWAAMGSYPVPGDFGFTAPAGVSMYGGFVGGESSIQERNPANRTHLNGLHPNYAQVVMVFNGPTPGTVLDGFKLDGVFSGLAHGGGGIIVNGGTLIVRNCHFFKLTTGHAAGAKINSASVSFEDCIFQEGWSQVGDSGGIGAFGSGSLTVVRCQFLQNFCREILGVIGRGAGIFCDAGYTLRVRDSVFDNNWAYNLGNEFLASGGGIASLSSDAVIENCVFTRNRATLGGGIYCEGPTSIINCVLVANKATEPSNNTPFDSGMGGGIYGVDGVDLVVTNCTIVANWSKHTSAGVQMDGAINNSILFHNVAMWEPPDDPEPLVDQQVKGSVDITYSTVAGLLGGGGPNPQFPGSIEVAPSFVVNPSIANDGNTFTLGDTHLVAGSPGVDAGSNPAVPSFVTTDADGLARFVDDPLALNTGQGPTGAPLVDMGAYEVQVDAPACYADCDESGDLAIDDFICFQTFFALGDPYADCDGSGDLAIDDFICFQTFFAIGC